MASFITRKDPLLTSRNRASIVSSRGADAAKESMPYTSAVARAIFISTAITLKSFPYLNCSTTSIFLAVIVRVEPAKTIFLETENNVT